MRWNTDQKRLMFSGAVWSFYEALTAGFLIVFAISLGASNTVVGILGALPYLAVILMEFPGAKLVEYFKRKAIFVVATSISRCTWLLILLTPYLFKEYTLWFVGGFFFLMRCVEYTADPAWSSWVADIVPDKVRGAFWGRRNMLVSFAGMIATLIGGVYLDLFQKESHVGFATMFGIAIIIGLWSTRIMAKIKEPEYRDHDHHGIKDFFSVDGQFRKYCWTIMAFYFGVNIASPLFTAYMIHDLGLSYTYFVLAGAIATVCRILSQPHFGYVSDRYGDKPVGLICMLGTALVPLSFIFVTKETFWLIIPAQILSGIAWAGMDLSIWNLLLDLTQKEKRALQVAEFNFLTSIPMIIAPVIGGIIADNLTLILTGIPLVFAIATILRALPALALMRIHETRTGPEHPISEVFAHVITIHPFHGMEHAIKVVVKRIKSEFSHIKAPYPINSFRIRQKL
ncbi:MAG: MFS transporter [Candidatus Woesearchaeota archaeon]